MMMEKVSLRNRLLPVLLLFCALLLMSGCFVRAEEESAAYPESASGEESVSSDEEGVYNFLLVGLDLREDESWNGNSDVVILLTVNDDAQKLVMTSFMRDLYAEIPGYGVNKLNYAYAVGGASTLIDTLEDNYDLKIDNYAAVTFTEMAEIIDLIGGVDMEVSDSEAELVNGYLESMGQYDDYLYGGGIYHLDGYQAVAYMRVRYVGNDDYERTERQRNILAELFVSLGEKNAAELAALAVQIITLSDTDVTALEMIALLPTLTGVTEYNLVESRIPYDDLYTSTEDGLLKPDFAATIERLHETMYEE